jgi:hypothetical protein
VLWSFGAYSQSKKNAKLLEKYAMPKSPMETVLQKGINGPARGYFFCSPYNEPHPGGIQRKTQRKDDLGLRIADWGLKIIKYKSRTQFEFHNL